MTENNVTFLRGLVSPEVPWQENQCTLVKRPSPELTRRQATALRAIHIGMEAAGVTDNDGRKVHNINSAMRALLDLFANEIEAAKLKAQESPGKPAARTAARTASSRKASKSGGSTKKARGPTKKARPRKARR